MENISINLNMSAFIHVVTSMKGKNGKQVEGLFIPIEKNGFFKGTKGYRIDLIGFPIKNKSTDSRDTHIIKQSFSKETREAMTKEQIEKLPIFGNLIDWKQATPQTTDNNIDTNSEPTIPENDLPF